LTDTHNSTASSAQQQVTDTHNSTASSAQQQATDTHNSTALSAQQQVTEVLQQGKTFKLLLIANMQQPYSAQQTGSAFLASPNAMGRFQYVLIFSISFMFLSWRLKTFASISYRLFSYASSGSAGYNESGCLMFTRSADQVFFEKGSNF
jgi:hypothetical protein